MVMNPNEPSSNSLALHSGDGHPNWGQSQHVWFATSQEPDVQSS